MAAVEIVERSSGKVVKRMPGLSERQAEKVERGANINLNHDAFFTRLLSDEEEQAAERLRLAERFLEQRASLERCDMQPAAYLVFRMGCTLLEAETMVKALADATPI